MTFKHVTLYFGEEVGAKDLKIKLGSFLFKFMAIEEIT